MCFVFSRQLTWRDLQHITVLTARRANLEADDWVKNGAGRLGIESVPFGCCICRTGGLVV